MGKLKIPKDERARTGEAFWGGLGQYLASIDKTLSWLCKISDLANGNVYKYRNTNTIPSEAVLQKLAQALNTDMGTLLRGELMKKPPKVTVKKAPILTEAVEEYELKEEPPKRKLIELEEELPFTDPDPEPQEDVMFPPEEDMVNHPSHYTQGGVECIEAIKAALTPEEFTGYLKGNVIKYIWREKQKGGLEDMQKAQWYLAKLIEGDY